MLHISQSHFRSKLSPSLPFRFLCSAPRMKREVASSLVERGVAERVRLTQAYEKKRTELQKQHDAVRTALQDHKTKVRAASFRSLNRSVTHTIRFFSARASSPQTIRPNLCWRRRATQNRASVRTPSSRCSTRTIPLRKAKTVAIRMTLNLPRCNWTRKSASTVLQY